MKRFIRWSLISFGALLVVYLVALGLYSIQPYVNDADLRPKRGPLPDEENAFVLLEKAADSIWWPAEMSGDLSNLVRNTNWNPALAANVLAKNSDTLRLFDAATKLPGVQVPEYKLMTEELPYLSHWKRLAEIAAIRANAEFRAGREEEAFRQAINLIQLGRRMQAGGGANIHYLVGAAVKSVGIWRIRDWAASTHPSPAQLTAIVRELDKVPDDSEPLAESLKAEYQVAMATLLEMRSGRMIVKEDGSLKRYVPIKFLPVYNHGKTRRLFANTTRQIIQCLDVPYSQANRPNLDSKRPGPAKLILSGNVAGEVSYWMMMPAVEQLIAKRCQERVELQTTRILLAMRAYQLKHGRLPSDLAALTPQFLPEVPPDAFNGESLLYSPDQRVIYSVGPNLKDDDGSITRDESGRSALDYGCSVTFHTP